MSTRTVRVGAADLRPGDVIVSGTQAYVVERAATHDDDPAVLRGRIRLTLRKHLTSTRIELDLGPGWLVNRATTATGGLL